MFDMNDPRLTAYVLGELDDPSRVELEAELDCSPELRRAVEELRRAAAFLRETLQSEPAPALTAEQREAIRAASVAVSINSHPVDLSSSTQEKAAVNAPREKSNASMWLITAGIAAALVIGVVSVAGWNGIPGMRYGDRDSDVAMNKDAEVPWAAASSQLEQRSSAPDFSEERAEVTTDGDLAFQQGDFGSRAPQMGGFDAPADFNTDPSQYGAYAPPRQNRSGPASREEFAEPRIAEGAQFAGGYGEAGKRMSSVGGFRAAPGGDARLMQGDFYDNSGAVLNRDGQAIPADDDALALSQSETAPPQRPSSTTPTAPPALDSPVAGPQPSSAATARPASPRPALAPSETPPGAPKQEAALERITEDLESEAATPLLRGKRQDGGESAQLPDDSGPGLVVGLRPNLKPGESAQTPTPGKQQQGQQATRESGESEPGEERGRDRNENNKDGGQQAKEDAEQDAKKKELEKSARTWRRARAVPNASRLMIGDHDELPLEGMQANVTIDGFRARVLLDIYYYNNRGQQLEGAFKLRLPNEASLYYFAFGESSFEYRPMVDQLASRGFLAPELIRASGTGPEEIVRVRADTWTKVKEARIVPREKAAHAYSETVRRRVDPALVEWSGAGVFNARVFPLMPGKLHRIVVGYDVNLTHDGETLTYSLDMPKDLSQAHVDLNVAAVPGGQAEVTPPARPFMTSGRAYYHLEGPWAEPLAVKINAPETMVLHGKDSEAGPFFATRIAPKLPADESNEASSHAVFLVDTSLSANPDKFNVWLKLLETTLAKNRDTMEEFAVLFFNVESHWWQEKYVENNPENVQELLNYCNTLALEGATDLRQALAEATSPSWPESEKPASQPDVFLLSDGAATWGERNVHLLAETLRSGTGGTLFAYQTGLTGTAVGVLEHLARESGGAVFSVAREDEIEQAATAHRQRPWRLLEVLVPGGSDLLVAGRPKSIYPGQTLLIVGRGEPGNEVVLRVARGEDEETVRIPLGEAVESETAARLYGQVAVGQLEDLGAAVEDVSIAYARHFRITGQTCSLLMLESEADYQRFDIRPEDDAFVVKSSAASGVIANKLDELGEHLTDPKKALELWLAKMENTPGVQFKLSTAMKLALQRLPAEALAVTPPRLECEEHSREALPKPYFQQLEAGQLDYDMVTAEAARRKEKLGAADALKALSSLIENDPGDPTLARDVAFSAIEWGLGGQAYSLLRRVADARPYEPQVYQALAHCAAEAGNPDLAIVYYEVALGGRWHERYQDFNRIAGMEYIHLLRRIDQGELSSNLPDYAKARLESLTGQFGIEKADLVVTMMWNTDRTDVDLHVREPSGEECYYKNRNTRAGGEITRDVTEGYGPEMYIAREAQHGKYVVRANYYGSDANRTQVRSKVYVAIYEDFGGRKERVTRKIVPLSRGKELRDVAEVFVEKQ